ncbi:unnamed protein product [Arctogadus glacialis]
MPGKCKFQVAWLSKDIYKDWLVKDPQDIQLARCKACCKAIKLQTMGEAALTSHAAGCGHKAAVRKLVEATNANEDAHASHWVTAVKRNCACMGAQSTQSAQCTLHLG